MHVYTYIYIHEHTKSDNIRGVINATDACPKIETLAYMYSCKQMCIQMSSYIEICICIYTYVHTCATI